jgi:transposase-like protein
MPIPTESAPTLALPMLTSTRLFGDGKHGQTECIQTFRCQACYSTFSARRNTPLYRLRTSSHQVAVVLSALAEGFDPSAAERVFGFRQATITTWLSRAGEHAHTLHERFFFHLQLPHRGPAPGRAGTFRRTRLSHPASMAAIGGHKNTINATGNHPSWASPRSPAYCGPRSAGRRKRGCRPQQNLCSKRYLRHVKRLLSAPHKSWSP